MAQIYTISLTFHLQNMVRSENKIVSVLEMIQKELHQEQFFGLKLVTRWGVISWILVQYIGNYLTQQHAGNDLAIQHTVNSEPGNIKHPFNII